MGMKLLPLISLAILLAACTRGAGPAAGPGQAGNEGKCIPMAVERLPDMNVPRNVHIAAFVNGELTVIGGHTTGFIPTNTAEYYRDGA